MLPQLSLNKDLSSCEPILLSIPRKLSKRRVEPDVGCEPSRHHDSTGGKRDMSTLRQFRNFWLPWVRRLFWLAASDAGAQTSYKVTDLGTLGNDNMSCAMTLNNRGWTAIQDGNALPGQQDADYETSKRTRCDRHRRSPGRSRHARREEQFYELGRDQRPRADSRLFRNGGPGPERRRRLWLRHRPYVSPVCVARLPHERSPYAGRK